MDNRVIPVPVALLLDPNHSAAAKVVWMALRLHPAAGSTELEARTGLARHTLLKGREQAVVWNRPPGGPRVEVPAALLADRAVGAHAKVLYGLLQIVPEGHGQSGRFAYASLSALASLSRNTVKRAVTELASAGWLQLSPEPRQGVLRFTLGSPPLRRSLAEVAMAQRRLKRARLRGEAIMQEYLSLLIDSDEFTDNARPGFLVNPMTRERLELDRFYPPNVGFEFHGSQHDRASERFSQAEVEAQQLRDYIKAGICLYRGVHLIVVRAQDLSLQGMLKKIGRALPLRSLTGHEPLIDFLEEVGLAYLTSAEAGRRSDR